MSDFRVLVDQLALEREHLIRRALSEACHWARPSSKEKAKPSDRFWLECFGNGPVEGGDVQKFMTLYKIGRAAWKHDEIATEISNLRNKDWDPATKVGELADKMAKSIAKMKKEPGNRISAASKVAMFSRPDREVFIWDSLALSAVRLRDWIRADERGETTNHRSKFVTSYGSANNYKYGAYHKACVREITAEISKPDFVEAAAQFRRYLRGTNDAGILSSNPDFMQRRLFDKLLFCEGERIGEWREKRGIM